MIEGLNHLLESTEQPSYTTMTLQKLQEQGFAPSELFFIIGADAFAEIRTWKSWQDVVSALEFIVVSRPGHPYEIPAGAHVHRLDTLDLAVSSSEIRTRLAAVNAELDVPTAVLDYICERNLYSPQM